ncbi:MAG TPA: UDP-N-acetylmuramoyl-L-alanine--D-glutamate ligase [Thermoanaerobaculia bacterium]
MTKDAANAAGLPARVAVMGLARSGRALASALLDRGVAVAAADDRPAGEFSDAAALASRGARLYFGGEREGFLEGAGWLALSPGVPPTHATVLEARRRGLPVYAEIEIAWRIAESQTRGNRWVAVTGTNGKSTTTSWIADMLRRAGRPVALAGNIGAPLSGFLAERTPRDFVCEVSSFQLESIAEFRADVAVLTNVTPDHLDRYPDMAAYTAAKARVFENQRAEDVAVTNADDAISRGISPRARRAPFSRRGVPPGGAGVEGELFVSEASGKRRDYGPARAISLPGVHNLENALAAAAAAESLGAPAAAVGESLARFEGLPHRMQLVAESGGVRWVNDSKGTNVDATIKSLEGMPAGSVLLILGGRDKHGDFPQLAGPVARAARAVLTIGEAAGPIAKALEGTVPIESCGTMERAVERAASLARRGDTVLLSPACASFDQYVNFEERGNHFETLVRRFGNGNR